MIALIAKSLANARDVGAKRVPSSGVKIDDYLALADISKAFDSAPVLRSFSLSASKGEFITLLGPSGCGKTTLLRMVAGLLRADSGTIKVDSRVVTHLPAYKRNIGMVFQSYALFPHLTVAENIAFGLRAKGQSRTTIEQRVAGALAAVQLSELSGRSVRALSGGQQQRVALARAMIVRPAVMLLDEPFSALDHNLREAMRIETRQILRKMGATVIFVTHDQEEALVMSDRVAVMNKGRAEQIADPKSIYSSPATPFVLGFVGQALRLRGCVQSVERGQSAVRTSIGLVQVERALSPGMSVLVAVRPELIELARGDSRHNGTELQIRELAFLGSKTQIFFTSHDGDILIAELPGPPSGGLESGARVHVRWPIEATLAYVIDG